MTMKFLVNGTGALASIYGAWSVQPAHLASGALAMTFVFLLLFAFNAGQLRESFSELRVTTES